MTNIRLDERVLNNIKNENLIAMLNDVIDGELSKDISQVDTFLVEECVDLVTQLEKEQSPGFSALVPLMSSDQFLKRITNDSTNSWKKLNVFARAAIVAAIVAAGTFSVNAGVRAITGVDMISQLVDYFEERFSQQEETPALEQKPQIDFEVSEAPVVETVEEPAAQQEQKPKEEPQKNAPKPQIKTEYKIPRGDEPQQNEEASYIGMTADFSAMKQNYIIGESLDYSGLVLYANYSDHTQSPINLDDCVLTNNIDTSKMGDYTLRIAYNDTVIDFDITVRPDEDTRYSTICNNSEYDYLLTTKGAYILRYNGSDKHIVADAIDGNSVYAVSPNAFANGEIEYFASSTCQKIMTSAFENSSLGSFFAPRCTYIGDKAFNGCRELENIDFSDSMDYLGGAAFMETAIKEIVVPAGISKINEKTFSGCPALERVELKGDVIEIGSYAFNECESLTELVGTGSIQKVDDLAFYNDTKMTFDEAPEKLVYAGELAFAYCNSVKLGTLRDLIHIGDFAFEYCYNIDSVFIKNEIESVPYSAFRAARITALDFEEGVKEIDDYAFMGTMISELHLPKSLERIGTYAFYTNRLRKVYGERNIKIVEPMAFYPSNRLSMVVYTSSALHDYVMENNIEHVKLNDNGAIVLPDRE